MNTVAFTIVNDKYYYPVGTHIFINSFKYFHPDIPLVIFRQNTIDKIFEEKKINFYCAKPTFARLLTDKYDKIVNIDADTIILSRLDEVFDQDYDVGGVLNLNDYENIPFENITKEMYVQAGMVGSTKKEFWEIWEKENIRWNYYKGRENDILNLVWYNNPIISKMNRIIWDKGKNYLGCKSLNRESEFYMEGKKVICRGEQVKAYHWAHGGVLPKMIYSQRGFPPDVIQFMEYIGNYGQTITIT